MDRFCTRLTLEQKTEAVSDENMFMLGITCYTKFVVCHKSPDYQYRSGISKRKSEEVLDEFPIIQHIRAIDRCT